MTRFEQKQFTIPVRDSGAKYRDGHDRIFGPQVIRCNLCGHPAKDSFEVSGITATVCECVPATPGFLFITEKYEFACQKCWTRPCRCFP